jgi:peptidyl-prolyl cis-trans isomerase A (cyclophilin A)
MGKYMELAGKGVELKATFETTLGSIEVKLFSKAAPETVKNFVGLATGEKEWTHPATQAKMKETPLYDGTLFHRCIKDFMVQGGDPLGRGTGGPGYKFADEFQSGLRFDKVGLLAMANAGPGTNGSQFFITAAPTPWLNNKHTIFGEVTAGLELVTRIANDIPKGAQDRPKTDVVITKLTISELS